MAADTGGDFVRNANQLGGELEKVADRTSLVYLLVYSPKALTKPGAFHALKVNVKASGAKVVARSGYYEPRPYRTPDAGSSRSSRPATCVTGGIGASRIETRLTAAAFASPSEDPQVPIVLEVPGRSLLAGDTGEKSGVQIYAYANDLAGTLADYVASEIALDLSKVRPTLEASGLKFYGTLYLPPGEYGLRVLVRNTSTGHAGVAAARLTVPAIPGGAPSVLPPSSPTEPTGRLADGARDAPRRRAARGPPTIRSRWRASPSSPPRCRRWATARTPGSRSCLQLRRRPASPPRSRWTCGSWARTARRRPPARGRRSPRTSSAAADRSGSTRSTPSGLPPGRYALKVVVTDTATHASAESASPFDIK